jgi:hypothetical protein
MLHTVQHCCEKDKKSTMLPPAMAAFHLAKHLVWMPTA